MAVNHVLRKEFHHEKKTPYFLNYAKQYTDSPYPLQYYFELRDARGHAWLYPGFRADLCNQPYFVVRQVPERS